MSGAVRGNITIPCRPEGSPKPTIKWRKRSAGGAITDISVTINSGQQPTDNTAKFEMTLNGDLIIRDITSSDAGDYICTATNDQGEDNSACTLEVQGGFHYKNVYRIKKQQKNTTTMQIVQVLISYTLVSWSNLSSAA